MALNRIIIPQALSVAVCEISPHSSFELDAVKPAGMRYDPFEMGVMAGKAMVEPWHMGSLWKIKPSAPRGAKATPFALFRASKRRSRGLYPVRVVAENVRSI